MCVLSPSDFCQARGRIIYRFVIKVNDLHLFVWKGIKRFLGMLAYFINKNIVHHIPEYLTILYKMFMYDKIIVCLLILFGHHGEAEKHVCWAMQLA